MTLGTDRPLTVSSVRRLVVILAVFGITGILALVFSRFMLQGVMGMEGSLWSGPWSYRLLYLLLVPPFYSATLVAIGTLFGQHEFFKRQVMRMWRRPLPFLRRR